MSRMGWKPPLALPSFSLSPPNSRLPLLGIDDEIPFDGSCCCPDDSARRSAAPIPDSVRLMSAFASSATSIGGVRLTFRSDASSYFSFSFFFIGNVRCCINRLSNIGETFPERQGARAAITDPTHRRKERFEGNVDIAAGLPHALKQLRRHDERFDDAVPLIIDPCHISTIRTTDATDITAAAMVRMIPNPDQVFFT
eukprot:CAMPEP_0178649960 /NCGR_PEP_ID=MMETSP0698-20121128/21307_1 /TAXON_ID=265572 /ORGANISM="Extubocellulus spinifer, Strain CCMP396" /LENGTH=196 /DNA_ID=CAMNT_0020291459 /DNA_START=33 /DNA_END=619 /DNA_ORIENTATION=-